MFEINATSKANSSRGREKGDAGENLEKQIPLIANYFPEIANVRRGTLKLETEFSLLIAKADFRSPKIDWQPQHHPGGEVFDLQRIILKMPSGRIIPAWIYIAHNSYHRKNSRMHEVICEDLGHVTHGSGWRIFINRDVIEIPYREAKRIVVV